MHISGLTKGMIAQAPMQFPKYGLNDATAVAVMRGKLQT
jgi:hypothetical protein